jgi:hypothetical protein
VWLVTLSGTCSRDTDITEGFQIDDPLGDYETFSGSAAAFWVIQIRKGTDIN